MATKERKPLIEIEDKSVRVNISTYLDVKKYCDENGVKISWFYNQAAKLYLLELNEKATA